MDRDWIAIVGLGMVWGSAFAFNEVLLHEMGPVTVSLSRVGLAAIGCWAWLAFTGQARLISVRQMRQTFVMGLLMFGFPFAIYPIGQQYIPSGVAGIVNALTPIMVVIVSHLWPGGERATVQKSLGVALGFSGILLLALPALRANESARLFGILFTVLAPLCYALASNYVRRLHALDPTVMVTWAMTWATVAIGVLALAFEGIPGPFTGQAWASMAVLGFGLTAATFVVFFRLMPRAGATKKSTVTFVAPVSALLIGAFLLDEEIGMAHVAGMGAIFAGLVMIDGRLFRRLFPKIN